MKHYGNVSKINGAEVEPVDVITFGSPCQDLSVAGKRAGIQDGERSNLFFEAIRIVKEMRDSTNGEYPKYAVWENVPGAFSSNKGYDFHAVLEALCSVCDSTVSIPKPYDAKRTNQLVWSGAGEIVGDNYSIAWRTLDAQYWGVPQRRKRIYLVADFTGRRAGEILFKPESLRGDMQQGNEAGQGSSADAVGGTDGSVGAISVGFDRYNGESTGSVTQTLAGTSRDNNVPHVVFSFDSLSSNSIDQAAGFCQGASPCARTIGYQEEVSPTVKGAPSGTAQVPAVVMATQQGRQSLNYINPVCYDARGNGDGETACTRTGDHQNRITDYTAVACFQNTGRGWWNESNTAATVRTACGGDSVKANLAVRETLCFDETQITSPANGNNPQWNEPSHPLASTARPPTVICKQPPRRYIVRRLTPTECARLQGFPDKWGHLAPYDPADAEFWENVRKTHAEINGKKYKPTKNLKKWYEGLHTDSAEYKAYGNGLALPCAEFVIRGIAEVLRDEKGQFASKGGVIEYKGYTCIYKPGHPRAKTNGYVREHILVAEEMLGRPLDGEEVVHHINGDKADNRPENLEIFPTHAEHVRHHNRTDGKKYSYNGGEFTVAELSEFSVVDYSVLTQRINKLGWDIKRAVETPKRGQPTLGSLFDGIGGFPLAGVLNGIKPVWASEIEPFPIAVTKSRFREVQNDDI